MYVLDTNTLIYFSKEWAMLPNVCWLPPPRNWRFRPLSCTSLRLALPSPPLQEKGGNSSDNSLLLSPSCRLPKKKLQPALPSVLGLKKGTPIDPLDVLIGGTALANNGVLVTRNTAEFKRINKLKVEDWF